MPPQQPTPEWQSVSRLPLLAQHIDGWLTAVEVQYSSLQGARERPSVLDDFTVSRVIQVFTTQRDDLWLFEEQLRRWQAEPLTEAQRHEVERLTGQMQRVRTRITDVLTLAEELKPQTIERLLAKSDLEVGLEWLQRLRPREQD